jgi:hypothetical protein
MQISSQAKLWSVLVCYWASQPRCKTLASFSLATSSSSSVEFCTLCCYCGDDGDTAWPCSLLLWSKGARVLWIRSTWKERTGFLGFLTGKERKRVVPDALPKFPYLFCELQGQFSCVARVQQWQRKWPPLLLFGALHDSGVLADYWRWGSRWGHEALE